MEVEKVTMNHLRDMSNDDTLTFNLPSASACNSGKSVAYQAQHLMGCRFKTSINYDECTLTIQKIAP